MISYTNSCRLPAERGPFLLGIKAFILNLDLIEVAADFVVFFKIQFYIRCISKCYLTTDVSFQLRGTSLWGQAY